MSEDCAYCKIAKGLTPCHKIFENDDFLAFLSIFPNTKGFTILITKEHYPSYVFDLPDNILTKLIITSKEIAKILDSRLDDVEKTGLILEASNIDHAHVKLIPMHGTKKINKWNPKGAFLDKFFNKYEGYLSSHESKRASDKELEKIAKKLKI